MAAFSERDFSRRGGWAFGDDDGRNLTRSTRVVQLFVTLLVAMLVWAYFATLDEVSTGDGRVIPTSREQVIQSLEGGIVATLHVREDQVVEPGQILAQLDPTRSESDVEESAAKYRATLAAAARLEA
ncbi:biotin/lipoyl-binding protein, partial [Rhizobium sp. TBD182]